MKKSKIFLSLFAAGALFTACNDLDQMPNGSVATEEQKKDAVAQNPELVSAAANALPNQLISWNTIFENHIDYGLQSSMLAQDCRGIDMASADVGYNWYSPALEMSDFNGRYFLNLMCWYYNYYTIRSCNTLLAGTDADTDNAEILYFRAQAYAFRAYCYFNLAQMYAFGYEKFYEGDINLARDQWPAHNPAALCVPVITDENMDEAAANGLVRSTVAEVYRQINDDLTMAITLLDRAEEEGVTRKSINAATPNIERTFVNQCVAYALRARANLFCCKYTVAAEDAAKALELANEEGRLALPIELVAKPGFDELNSTEATNFLWGTYADPSERRYTALVCWASHVTGFQTNGYAGAGVYRCVNKALYESIPASDKRKAWWLDAAGNPPSTLPTSYANYIKSGYASDGNEKFPPYAQLKFGAYEDAPSTKGCIDYPWIRVEELYLIKAEGEAYTSLATGRQTLMDFVKTYRNPDFTCNPTDFNNFQDIVWNQRRIELWGEGISYADLQRLQKPIDRRGGGFPTNYVLNVSADDVVRLYDIPQAEIERNPLIVDGTHGAVQPRPVADID